MPSIRSSHLPRGRSSSASPSRSQLPPPHYPHILLHHPRLDPPDGRNHSQSALRAPSDHRLSPTAIFSTPSAISRSRFRRRPLPPPSVQCALLRSHALPFTPPSSVPRRTTLFSRPISSADIARSQLPPPAFSTVATHAPFQASQITPRALRSQ
ncbi:hypothetical protein PYCCODRAFT_1236724 [Trametes coccinea BRFM310]|uniref:Uncharacterized protein n=1 Tax=Trametes coccinea (strain BRFM310) TaxID=1353009 RepID=A0A1Y2IWD0_TRAC3|nr:hypothetical protein PYCCODRAFT_1236724 [Trametes coccinea BRFM310]